MIKSIKTIQSTDKEKYKLPKKVQDVIPIKRIWPDGIFQVGSKFVKSWKFADINYLVASREDKESMFLTYSELLNSLDSGATTKITINNHRMKKADFEESVLMPLKCDGLDDYRREYNQMLLDKAMDANGIMQEKYITVTVAKKNIEDARAYFARTGAELSQHLTALGSRCIEMTAVDRLRALHDFYRSGEENAFAFNLKDNMRKGHCFRDYICPDSIEKHADFLRLGEKYARVLYLKDYASYIKDSMVIFTAAAIVSGVMFARQYSDAKASVDTFDDLAGLVVDIETPLPETPDETDEPAELTEEELRAQQAALAHEKYGALFEQNQDFIGWISIDGTNINYPVMQTPTNPDYYLKHAFDKSWSDYGVPYIEESCIMGISNNIVIYGHHMKNGSMFADLCNYTDEDFWREHPLIHFDTLSSFGEYEIVAVFRFNTNKETFKYNECVTMNEEEFNEFMQEVHAREMYDTGIDAEYSDQLLTLSTCEYFYKNGRFVVVAKKVV